MHAHFEAARKFREQIREKHSLIEVGATPKNNGRRNLISITPKPK
jgi:hypothetical protein